MISRYLQLVLFLFCITVFSAASSFVHAQDAASEDGANVDEQERKFMSVHDKVKEFTEGFDDASERHFYALYGSYNMIQVVEDVRAQVGNAIEKCVEVNPDMKEALETRYTQWTAAIDPIMKEADANVDNMVIAQDYAKPAEIRKLFKFIDKKRVGNNNNVDKFPITTPEACEYLRVKMDETEDNLTRLLQSTLVSLPQSLLNADDASDDDDDDDHDHGPDSDHQH